MPKAIKLQQPEFASAYTRLLKMPEGNLAARILFTATPVLSAPKLL